MGRLCSPHQRANTRCQKHMQRCSDFLVVREILIKKCKELTHWKRPWCWEGLGAGGEGDDRGWDGWMASPTRWAWVWVNSGSWWWTGRPGVLWFMGLQRLVHDWATEPNWTELTEHILVIRLSNVKRYNNTYFWLGLGEKYFWWKCKVFWKGIW